MASIVEGIVPPLVTPRGEGGDVDRDSVARLVEHLIAGGVSGLFVCGSSGEAALLSNAQKRQMVRYAVRAAAGRVPVYAGAIATGTNGAIEQARDARAEGASAIVATTPFYVAPNPAEIERHFRRIREAVDLPLIAYDIASATHVPLPESSFARLAHDGTIDALKDSSGDITKFRDAVLAADGAVKLFTGSETFSDLAVELGATGIVPGLGNVDPTGYVHIFRAVRAGDLPAARREQERMLRLFRIVDVADRSRIGFTAGALGSFKAALYLRGVIADPSTFDPLGALVPEEFERIGRILRACDVSVDPQRLDAAVAAGAR